MAKKIDGARKKVPPYMSYKTFLSFLDALRVSGVPTRLDRSLVPSMSGSNQALLFSTLRYLGLVTNKGAPTQNLDTFVNAKMDDRKEIWRQLIINGYTNLFTSDIDIERATTQELAEVFAREGVASSDTVRKCVTFFSFAAKDAGIKLSPHIKPYAGRRQTSRRGQETTKEQGTSTVPRSLMVAPGGNGSTDWQLLLSKFPDFDRSWPDDLKKKWFDGFERLSRMLNTAKATDELPPAA